MAATIDLDLRQLVGFQHKLDRLLNFDRGELLQGLGALLELQTKRRIEVEKAAPDGRPWPNWTPSYASQRPGGTSLLQSSNHLLQSILNKVEGDSVAVGSPLEYARIHNDGGTTSAHVIRAVNGKALAIPGVGPRTQVNHPGSVIPQRQYLGISADNRDEIEAKTVAFLEDLLQ